MISQLVYLAAKNCDDALEILAICFSVTKKLAHVVEALLVGFPLTPEF